MSLTSKKFFYSALALALTLQLSTPSYVLASGTGTTDMEKALGTAPAKGPARPAPTAGDASDGLDDLLSKQNYPAAFAGLIKSGNKASDADIVEFLLTSNGYAKERWVALPPARRAAIVAKISGKPAAADSTCSVQ